MIDFSRVTGFDWDAGNDAKCWKKHRVTSEECEQVFFNRPLLVDFDEDHSIEEDRYYLLGKTDRRRELFVVFTTRGCLVRVISARDMTAAERRRYRAPNL